MKYDKYSYRGPLFVRLMDKVPEPWDLEKLTDECKEAEEKEQPQTEVIHIPNRMDA